MKRVALVLCSLFIFVQYSIADSVFQEARTLYIQGKYSQAKNKFLVCLNNPEYADVKDNISVWITNCDAEIQEQNINTQLAAERRRKKLEERKNNQYVHITVHGTESEEIRNRITSAMVNVLQNKPHKRTVCDKLDDALEVLTISIDVKPRTADNGFYKVASTATIRWGSALEGVFTGQWTVDSEATSVVGQDDAIRLLINKTNHKLAHALDNLLNGRPQESGYYIPAQTIAVHIDDEENTLSSLRGYINGHILKIPGLTLSNALDEKAIKANEVIAQKQAGYVKMESRAPVHELEGFSQILRISKIKDGNSFTFVGEVSEPGTGRVLTTVTINGADIGITTALTAKEQEIVAKFLAVGLGFKSWEIGESMGEYKLAAFDGLHGLLLKMTNEYISIKALSEQTPKSRPQDGCRLPYAEELLKLASLEIEQKLKLNLVNIYWTASIDTNNKSIAVDFRESEAIKRSLKNKENAYLLFVKDF